MWSNIGHKIQVLAKVICWLGIILSVLAGIAMIVSGNTVNNMAMSYGYYSYSSTANSTTLAGVLIIVLGALGSWLGSLTLYGFGELIQRTVNIDEKLSAGKTE